MEQNEWSPLYMASQNGNLDVVKTLIQAGANINQVAKDNETPLFAASKKGHHDVVQSLLGAGADVNIALMPSGQGPLWTASINGHLNVVKTLLAGGANVNQGDKDNLTPLYVASHDSHHGVVLSLLGAGADVNIATSDGWTPLGSASHKGHLEIVKKLIEAGANVNHTSKDNETPLFAASKKGHHDVVQSLLEAGADVNIAFMPSGQGPLLAASFNGHLNVVKTLLAGGANVNQGDKDGRSPLYMASWKGHLDVVKTLIEAGANINEAQKNGWTPLHKASQEGHLDVVKTLLEAGAYINQADKNGKTALNIAVIKGHNEIIEVLKAFQSKVHSHEQRRAPQIPPTKTELELKDVFDPIKTLAAEEWKELGKALCIENVESIPSKRGITKNDEAYLREVLRRWLNGTDPSIEDLIRALKECYCEEAAKELERRFAIADCESANMLHDDNHTQIFHMTKKACSEWRGIGMRLGFTDNELSAIVREPGRTHEEHYYSAMLMRWLDWAPPNHYLPSVQRLSSALREVGKERLAFDLDSHDWSMS